MPIVAALQNHQADSTINMMKDALPKQLEFFHDGNKTFIPAGTVISNTTVIAGEGTEIQLRTAAKLVERYGGKESQWQKMAGKIESDQFVFDIHWYQRSEEQRHSFKIKNKTPKRRD